METSRKHLTGGERSRSGSIVQGRKQGGRRVEHWKDSKRKGTQYKKGSREQQEGAWSKRGSKEQEVTVGSRKRGGEQEWGAGRTGSMEQEGE